MRSVSFILQVALLAYSFGAGSGPARASLRVSVNAGSGLGGAISTDTTTKFTLQPYSLNVGTHRHLVDRWNYKVGISLRYAQVKATVDSVAYKGFTNSIGVLAGFVYPTVDNWDAIFDVELVFRGLLSMEGADTATDGQGRSTVRTYSGFFGYALRLMFEHGLRWQHRDFFYGFGGEYLFHQIQNYDVKTVIGDGSPTLSSVPVEFSAGLTYSAVFLTVGMHLFKDWFGPGDDSNRSRGDMPRTVPEEKVYKSYAPFEDY